jgi:hypothetical protein
MHAEMVISPSSFLFLPLALAQCGGHMPGVIYLLSFRPSVVIGVAYA